MTELELRYGEPITLETDAERQILKQILEESKSGLFGKKAKVKQRRLAKKKKQEVTQTNPDEITFGLFHEIYDDVDFLLQHSSDAYELVTNGFRKGASYNAPGNPGSAFNEVVSNEGVMILNKKEMSIASLALVLFYRMKDTELAKQQKDQVRNGIEIPDRISRYDQDLYINCVLSARSAYQKYNRMVKGANKLNRNNTVMVFGGSVKDLKELSEYIISADTCYVYDEELDHLVKIPRLRLFNWALSAGGGKNTGDTVVLTVLPNGDILYDGWSDKKSLSDIQSNGTLLNDFNNYIKLLDKMDDLDIIIPDVHKEGAINIINEYKNQIGEIEKKYKNAALGESEYFLSLSPKRKKLLGIWLDIQETFYLKNKTSNHVENSKKADGFEGSPNQDYVDYLLKEGVHKSATRCKVINRMGIMERAWLSFKKEQIPFELDSRGIVSLSREDAMSKHTQCIEDLNQFTINYFDTYTPLGTLLTFLDGIEMLQIAKINKPVDLDDYDQYLKRNTHLIMGGVNVSPKLIKKSLKMKDISSFVIKNEILIKEEIMYDTKKKYVTGKNIHLVVQYENGMEKTIGVKTYRSRSGFSGKTSNTTTWSNEIVKLFKESRNLV